MCNPIKHGPECVMAFGRKSPPGLCLRCDELSAGAAPRAGWQGPYFTRKAAMERAQANAPKHDCRTAHCGPVCTTQALSALEKSYKSSADKAKNACALPVHRANFDLPDYAKAYLFDFLGLEG